MREREREFLLAIQLNLHRVRALLERGEPERAANTLTWSISNVDTLLEPRVRPPLHREQRPPRSLWRGCARAR